MVVFDPPTLKDELAAACQAWSADFEAPELAESGHRLDVLVEEDATQDEDDLEVTRETGLVLSIRDCDEYYETSCGGFIQLVKDIKSAAMEDNVICRCPGRSLVRIDAPTGFVPECFGTSDYKFALTSTISGTRVTCTLEKGFTLFGLMVYLSGGSDSWFPPVLHDDLFVAISSEAPLPRPHEEAVLLAYLFEFSSSLGLSLAKSPRPLLGYPDDYEDYVSLPVDRMRPLLFGIGIPAVLSLYNRAIASTDWDVQILYFTKVIEHIAQTVVRQQATEAIRAKLMSRRALQPDASFIVELEALIEGQRTFKKDREAIKQTVAVCCVATELATLAPVSLKLLKSVTAHSKTTEVEGALEAFARMLYATRNEVAHAKTNYTPTGDECPQDQLHDLAGCARVAAEQAIRWYHACPEMSRVV